LRSASGKEKEGTGLTRGDTAAVGRAHGHSPENSNNVTGPDAANIRQCSMDDNLHQVNADLLAVIKA
jgi:hypothetical protein